MPYFNTLLTLTTKLTTMMRKSIKMAVLSSILLFASCKNDNKSNEELMTDNLLLQDNTGPDVSNSGRVLYNLYFL